MLEAKIKLETEIKNRGIVLTGADSIPHIVQGRPLFDLVGAGKDVLSHFGQRESDLFMGEGLHNIALFPNGKVEGLKTVSNQYQVLQHDDAILKLFEALPETFDLKKVEVTTSPNGGKCFAKFTSGQELEVSEGDPINYQILLENSADTTKRFSIKGGAWRMICSNGMIIADSRVEQIARKKLHKGNLSLCDEIGSFMKIMDSSIASMGVWKDYVKKSLKAPDLEDVWEALEVGPRVQEEILGLELRGEATSIHNQLQNDTLTAWNLYNAFTQRITDSDTLESVKVKNGIKVSKYFDSIIQ